MHPHGRGLSGSVVSEESRDLSFVEGDAQTVHCRFGAATEHLDQVLHTNPHHQTTRLRLKKHLLCASRQDTITFEAEGGRKLY